jgi:hypothetical protein
MLHAVPVGPPQPEYPINTPVTFSRERPQDLIKDHDQVGVICASTMDTTSLTDKLFATDDNETQKDVAIEARRLGGSVIAVISTCSSAVNRMDGVELGVYRKRRPLDRSCSQVTTDLELSALPYRLFGKGRGPSRGRNLDRGGGCCLFLLCAVDTFC